MQMIDAVESLRNFRHIDKTFYLGADERFYELNYSHYVPGDELRSLVGRVIDAHGSDWDLFRSEVWTHVVPGRANGERDRLIDQGWKIHISATNLNCTDILERIASLAIDRGIQFKFANDVETLRMMTSKRWTRGGSGKFVTIYPASDDEFRDFIELAYVSLKGFSGSYILSDRRYKDSRCVYYRFGTIRSVHRMDYLGRRQEVLTAPDGQQFPDRRTPYFELPHWVSDPYPDAPLDEQVEMTLNDGRFVIKSALAFSNTGGVYLATDTITGKDVVIKEARPGVELGTSGDDATNRLAREAMILEIIAGTGIAPKLYTTFWDWENFYLVEEYLQAEDMRGVMLTHTPLLRVNPTRADSEAFYKVYRSMFVSLLDAIDRLHAQGVVVGDLSPTNILVDKTSMTVRIIDLEGAFRPGLDEAQDIHTPGFRPEKKRADRKSSYGDDFYAIGVIMMYSMFPIVAMDHVRNDVFSSVLPVLIADVGWWETPVLGVIQRLIDNSISCREAIAELEGNFTINPPSYRSQGKSLPPLADVVHGLARFTTNNYRLDDAYTLFPLDPFGRESNPLGFAFGSTGIIYSLSKCGVQVPREAMQRYRTDLAAAEPEGLPPGFLTGTAGMAWGLLVSNEIENGCRFLDHANSSPLARSHHSLYYGMAGIGMVNLAAYRITGSRGYLDRAVEFAEELARTAVSTDIGVHWRDEGSIRIGYGYGQSGVSLFLLRLSQTVQEPQWQELGKLALNYDLSFGHEVEPGIISFAEVPDNNLTLEQYIEQGSGGIAKVAIRYGMWDRIDGLLADMHRKYSGFPGLIYGLSGFIDVLTDAYVHSGDPKYLGWAERPLRGLVDLYLFEVDGALATPGENLFRISCDYATGLAGIMHTLHRHVTLSADEFCLDSLSIPAGA